LQTTGTPPASAQLSGVINGLSAIGVPRGHGLLAIVGYSQSDSAGEAANNLKTPDNGNLSVGGDGAFTVTTRTGNVALLALIYDRDAHGTVDPSDDSMRLIGWASRTGIAVADGVDQANQDLTLIDAARLENLRVDFGFPPPGLNNVTAQAGIELASSDGTLLMPAVSPSAPTQLAP